jgi:UDP-glucuronate 4-epimerase
MMIQRALLLLALFWSNCVHLGAAEVRDALGPESVVVITGAAGFLGSELAMALHHTYSPKAIICIDALDKGFGVMAPRTDQDLALFEFKRQRVFHLLQTIGVKAHFYRVDLRPAIPEYYDTGEVPVLEHIFQSHPGITHVVHFADHYHNGYLNQKQLAARQVVPRIKGQPKAGLMEAVLEQIRLSTTLNGGRQPHFVYASSYQVYKYANKTTVVGDPLSADPRLPPFVEETPITTPASVQGAAKLLDEVMAQTYYETEGIFSVGLRFFEIFGPWGLPGSPIFEMAERIVSGESLLMEEEKVVRGGATIRMSQMDTLDDVRDFLYIDDAMDAVMAAMQLRPTTKRTNEQGLPQEPPPLVINVGSGTGVTLRHIAKKMESFFPGSATVDGAARIPQTISFASTARAQQLLGFFPLVSLADGLEKTLAWHYDRAFSYGAKSSSGGATAAVMTSNIAEKGIVACSKYDDECLKGTPVFPCASECAHQAQCIPSFWDDVLELTKALTSGCSAVMYTIALEDNLKLLPSTVVQISDKSKPFVDQKGNCNVAFVSESSILYETASLTLTTGRHKAVQHGFWSLIPVRITDFAREQIHVLGLLPKLSPGQFFGISTRHAIYCDPDVIFHSIPRLLVEASMQPYNDRKIPGQTALLIGKRLLSDVSRSRFNTTRPEDQVQESAYRMIRIAIIEEMTGDGFAQLVDSSFTVHALGATFDDSRLFRCDVYGEVVQWDSSSDQSAFEFTMGLHDMWSRVIAKKMDLEPWWIGNSVRTVDQAGNFVHRQAASSSHHESRKLQEEILRKAEAARSQGIQRQDASSDPSHRRLEDEKNEEAKELALGDDGAADDAIVGDAEHNGFGLQDVARMAFGDRQQQQRHETPRDDDFDVGDDWAKVVLDGGDSRPVLPKQPSDPSSYDVWMGILSSTSVRSFSRIVTMEAVGAMHIENFHELAYS